MNIESIFSKTKLNPLTDCIEWQAKSCNSGGYGVIRIDGKLQVVTRVVYELVHEPLLKLCVLHCCDNRLCLNPNHLFAGTRTDNMIDKVAKGRQATGLKICKNRENNSGNRNGRAKLSSMEVIEIRELYNNRVYNQKFLAEIYEVNQSQISHIVNNTTY